ncbi:hypothetical protein JTB14_023999 [Gonioctena quinquepunctata]|nr:hypothetical protein JTB14_023999 [Gonioctena quinquepunctata]
MDELKNQSHLKDIPLEHFSNETHSILIEKDNAAIIVPRHVRSIHSHIPIATECKLGWSIHVPCHCEEADLTLAHTLHICNKAEDELLHDSLKDTFTKEFSEKQIVQSSGKHG